MEKLIAWTSPVVDAWRVGQTDILGRSALYLRTWPASGMTRNGLAFELPTWVPPTSGSECSSSPTLLKTPTAQLAVNGGSQHPDKRKEGGHGPTLADEIEFLLPTPVSRDHEGPTDGHLQRQGGLDLP